MKVHFNHFFDRKVYVNESLFDEKVVGPSGLLGHLELEVGIHTQQIDALERRNAFRIALDKYAQANAQVFYKNSFDIDPDNVTKELIRYYDDLSLLMIDAAGDQLPVRINALLEIGQQSQIDSAGNRWKKVFDKLETMNKDDLPTIVCHEDLAFLHPTLQKVMSKLNVEMQELKLDEENTDLSKLKSLLKNGKAEGLENDGSLKILQFDSERQAIEFISEQQHDKTTLILNETYDMFDVELAGLGNYYSGSKNHQSHALGIQLFKLVRVLFSYPLDIDLLFDYLQAPVHPIPGGLRGQLLSLLSEKGGLGNGEWISIVNDFEYKHDQQKERALIFTTFLGNERQQIEKSVVIELINSLADWSMQRYHLEEEERLRKVFSQLNMMSAGFNQLLAEISDDLISIDHLVDLMTSQYEPMSVEGTQCQKEGLFSIDHPSAILNFTDNLIWFDCYESTPTPESYQWVTYEEEKALERLGYPVWSKEAQVTMQQNAQQRAVLKTSSVLTLMTCRGKEEHPMLTQIKSHWPDDFKKVTERPQIVREKKTIDKKEILSNAIIFEELTALEHIKLRDDESYSSIENLIQNPFDWVFSYGLGIWPGRSFGSSEVFTVSGNMAHHYVDELLKEVHYDLAKAIALHEKTYTKRINQLIDNAGLALRQKTNRGFLNGFISTLSDRISELFKFLEKNQLKVLGSEVVLNESVNFQNNRSQNFRGFIDLLAVNENNEVFITDMKWARKASKYILKMKEDRDIQLTLYEKLLKESNAYDFKAYHSLYSVLSENKFISRKHLLDTVSVESHVDIEQRWQMLKNAVSYRLLEFKEGVLELGEEQSATSIPYMQDLEKKNLIPLEIKRGKKPPNYYSSYSVFKGHIN